jgi:hypothetical protein
MSKTFTIAGIATKDGVTRLHVSNGDPTQRARILARQGWTDITFVSLPKQMERQAAVDYLATRGMAVAEKPARASKAAKPATTKSAKKTDVVKVTKSKKRVGDAPRAGQSVEEFVKLWFADREDRARAKFPEIFN